jgi:citrate/tricarballylate utilization protein
MPHADLAREGARMATVCNSCRYCEEYCAVFPAIMRRTVFTRADLDYLAHVCHNCGECLYACQYAPPHQFAIDLPRMLAQTRLASYERYCWPAPLGHAFRRHGVSSALVLSAVLSGVLGFATWAFNPQGLALAPRQGDFYAVVPHFAMVTLFGIVGLFVVAAMAIGVRRFWRDSHAGPMPGVSNVARALRDALTLRNLHASGRDCTAHEEQRTPWRRWFHHCTFYGFLLCFASTCVAAVYHGVFGWVAPYAYTSAPVILGTAGGVGLLVGPVGLLWQRRRRDPALIDPDQHGLDESFVVLLWLTSLTGLLLLMLRNGAWMAPLLIVHLGIVLALFVTLPYGKFMHGLFRTAALIKSAVEEDNRTALLGRKQL